MLFPHKSQLQKLNSSLTIKLSFFRREDKKMSNNSQSMSFNAGQAKGQTQVWSIGQSFLKL